MSDGNIKINREYLRSHQVMSGKQPQDCETFGRSVLGLAMNRAMNVLGPSSAEDVTVEIKFKVKAHVRPGIQAKPCTSVSVIGDDDLDRGLAEFVISTHVED